VGNLTVEAPSFGKDPFTFGFFCAGLFAGILAFLRVSFTSSSAALSIDSSLSSSNSSLSDASFSASSPPLFRFALAGPACEDVTSGTNFSGALTARPDLRRVPDAAAELVASLLEISMSGVRWVVMSAFAALNGDVIIMGS
jgi:hypothetical protein